jgi:predicted lipid-binding transport protein (Tim44 family)
VASEPAAGPSVAAHPRASNQVSRAKGWGGLCGFLLGGYLSLPTNTLADAGVRALVAGVACYVVAWAAAVFVWRRLIVLEIKRREQELIAAVTGPEPVGLPVPGKATSGAAASPMPRGAPAMTEPAGAPAGS